MPELVIDAHVHLHGGDPRAAIAAAWPNMMAGRSDVLPVFMLAERRGERRFEALRAHAVETRESESLWVEAEAGRVALVLAGRQIVSAEGLEILALATSVQVEDGMAAGQVIGRLQRAGATIVLPWGVGKWLGRRGRLVDALLEQAPGGVAPILLGDNGGRPWFWPVPRFRGRRVLSGSDPLPLAGSEARIGSFGSSLHAEVSRDYPARDLRAALRDESRPIRAFGQASAIMPFLRDQIRLRAA